jgi:hypothetical protein
LIRGLKLKTPPTLYMSPIGPRRSLEPRGQAPGGGAPMTAGVRLPPHGTPMDGGAVRSLGGGGPPAASTGAGGDQGEWR